jgi:RimK-like ATP-grasp domain
MLILLWGIGSEATLAAVHGELDRLGATPMLIDQRDILDTEIELDISGNVRGLVRTRDRVVSLPEVTACYVRPYDWRDLPAIAAAGTDSSAWRHSAAVEDLLSCWSEITPALVVNRPAAMAGNGSKPFQLAQIHEFGFRVPETVVTTDPDVARAFWRCHGSVIYKSVSGVRSRVSRLSSEHLERLMDVIWCPTQFQQYIVGTDCRVHVVGNDVFACEVRSDADDYRYPGPHSVELQACRVPWEVEDRCRRLTSAMQLHVAGVDLRRTPDGEWYCFEVNPSPAFLYYETATGLPIAAAIARMLAAGSKREFRMRAELPRYEQ